MKDKGRIDWMPRKKVWKVVIYYANREAVVGYYATKEQAVIVLQMHARS